MTKTKVAEQRDRARVVAEKVTRYGTTCIATGLVALFFLAAYGINTWKNIETRRIESTVEIKQIEESEETARTHEKAQPFQNLPFLRKAE